MKVIVINATPDKLKQIYECLEQETRWFEARVSTGVCGMRKITIECNDEDYKYFKNTVQ